MSHTAESIIDELSRLGSPSIKKVLVNHGAKEPFFGVKVEDLKKIQKRVKHNYRLSLELYASGISDAMYLAGLISEPQLMKKSDLQRWVKAAYWSYLSMYTVAWVAAESLHGTELALEWIDSPKETTATCGWSTLASIAAITPDEDLDFDKIQELLERVQKEIHSAANRVRYAMNNFVIAVGTAVKPLTARAKAVARAIGRVDVDMGDTSCKVPMASEYIDMVIAKGRHGVKRKSAIC